MESRIHRYILYILPLLPCLWLTGTAVGGEREPGSGDRAMERLLVDRQDRETMDDGGRFRRTVGGANEISALHTLGDPRESENPDGPNPREGAYHLRMERRGEIWDLALHYTQGTRERTDFQESGEGFTPEKATIPVRWRLVAADLTARVGGLGLHAGGGHAWLDPESGAVDPLEEAEFKEDHARFLVGIDYTFGNSLYLVLEYFQDQSGGASPEAYSLNDRLAYLAGEKRSLGRDNLFVGAAYPLTEMTSVELYNIINANDPSVMINPWLVWSAGTVMDLSLSAQIPVGSEGSSLSETAPAAFGHIRLNF